MRRSETSFTTALLTSRIVVSEARPLTAREFWMTFPNEEVLHELPSMDVDQIAASCSVQHDEAERLRALLDGSRAFAFEIERLEESGISIVTAFDDAFPQRLRVRLGRHCPATLLTAGSLDWFSEPCIGIVGSRGISEAQIHAAEEAAKTCVAAGFGVISGLAKGIDATAMGAALSAGGRVCGIPTEGLRVVGRRPDIRSAIHDGVLAMASPYGPDAPFSAGAAMGRNKIVYGLAEVTVVITSDKGKGGTWGGATEALQKHYGQVIVWEGSDVGEGNRAIIDRGGIPIQDFTISSLEAALSKAALSTDGNISEAVQIQTLF